MAQYSLSEVCGPRMDKNINNDYTLREEHACHMRDAADTASSA